MLEILVVCLQVLPPPRATSRGSFRLQGRAAAAVVLAGVRNSEGAGVGGTGYLLVQTLLPPLPATGAHSLNCLQSAYPSPALTRRQSLSSSPECPSLLPIHPLTTPTCFLGTQRPLFNFLPVSLKPPLFL